MRKMSLATLLATPFSMSLLRAEQHILWAVSVAKCLTFSLHHSPAVLRDIYRCLGLTIIILRRPGSKPVSVQWDCFTHHPVPGSPSVAMQGEVLHCPEEVSAVFLFFSVSSTAYSVCKYYRLCYSELVCVRGMRRKAYGFKKSLFIALKGVTCCCLVSVCFFSTLISHKMFNLKTLEACRTDRNWQSQLRVGFSAAAALSLGEAWEKAAFGKTRNSILLHFVSLWNNSWTGSLFQLCLL